MLMPICFHKDLSIDRDRFFPADDGGGKMDKSKVAGVEFFEANEELAEVVEPAVCRLDDPASMLGRPATAGPCLAGGCERGSPAW